MKTAKNVSEIRESFGYDFEGNFSAFYRDNTLESSPLHYHIKGELLLLVDGECNFFVDDKIYNLTSGNIIYIPPLVLHKANYPSHKPGSRFIIFCDPTLFPKSVQKLLPALNYYVGSIPEELGNAEELFRKIYYEHKHPDELSDDMIKSHLAALGVMLLRASKRAPNTQLKSKTDFIEVAISYIKCNYSSHITLDDVAKYAKVSGMYLSRSFKKETGFGFNEYLTLYRLKQAEFMIIEYPDKSIIEIAYDCGFNDSNYFTARFKKVYGFPPSQLRKDKKRGDKRYIISL